MEELPPVCQANSLPARIADSSSTNAVSFSSATKRFPSSRCASATKIRSSARIDALDAAPAPTGFAEIVPKALVIVLGQLRRGAVHLNLRAHFLQTRSKHCNLLLLLRDL
jgi:hypothetical protein